MHKKALTKLSLTKKFFSSFLIISTMRLHIFIRDDIHLSIIYLLYKQYKRLQGYTSFEDSNNNNGSIFSNI